MRTIPAVLALLCLAPLSGGAATLRADTALSRPTVWLSDLFEGVDADRAIGPGPAPGGRIVVEAAQLAAIARQFGVDWRPASTADRIALEWPGHPFPREEAMAALRTALAVAGVSADAEVDVPGFLPPDVPAGVAARAEVGQLEYDGLSGRFTAMLSVAAAGMAPARARLSGRVTEMVEMPVAAHRMMPGDLIGPRDIQTARLRVGAVRAETVQVAAQAVGMVMRHPVGAGAPLLLADLGRPMAVRKGDNVQMTLDGNGVSVSAQGVAMDAGSMGERVRVLNAASRAIVEGEVVGSGQIRVSGTAPVLLPPGAVMPVRVATR